MRKLVSLSILIILVMSLSLAEPSSSVFASRLTATSPTLGAAESYSVLGAETVTNTGNTTIAGDLGVSPGSAVTGFPPGSVTPPYTIHMADGSAAAAQIANSAAFGALDQGCTVTYPGVKDLVGLTLVPGVYCADAFRLTGKLILDGLNTDVWIFKSASDLVTSGPTAEVVGPPNACYVWWRVVSSATLGTGTKFIGNILASTSIWLNTGASLLGRAFAYTGEVTLDNNTISAAVCLAPPAPIPTATPTTTPTVTPTATPTTTTATQTAIAAATQTAIAASATPTTTTATQTAIAAATQTAIAATATPTTTTATQTAIAAATQTAIAATATPTTTPVVPGLPSSGGAPIRNDGSPWGLLIAGGFSALTLFLGVRAYRKVSKPRQ